jgi:filamentous hemagglutinin
MAIFYDVLRDAGRDHNAGSLNGGYSTAYQAISALFPGEGISAAGEFADNWPYHGDITLTSREIKTANGGNISLLVPNGQVTVGLPVSGGQSLEQGIFTVTGGNISIFANGNINVGVSRIFTLDGGNEIIWSSQGDIDAGASSKTVVSAPPTEVIVDPQSGNVQTDLAGLATGGGIGVLQAFVGASASNVDLVAPNGVIDAGDAGIRASGNINVAAQQVLNASNISSGGKSTGVPTTSTPNIAGLSAASSAAGAATQSSLANTPSQNGAGPQTSAQDLPSIITVEVLGYGGGDTD